MDRRRWGCGRCRFRTVSGHATRPESRLTRSTGFREYCRVTGHVNSARSALPRSTRGEKEGYESIVSEDGDIGQEANCARDLAAFAERKSADANADGPDGSQQPHAREIRTQTGREIVRVRKDSASRANESSDSGCYGDASCCRSPLPPGERSAEQHLNDEGRNQGQDDAPSDHNNWKFKRRCSSCVE